MIYTGDGWEIRCGRWECTPPVDVDCILSDPPYDERTHVNGRSGVGWSGYSNHRAICVNAPKSFDPVDPRAIGPELVFLARRWAVLFCSVEQIGLYAEACGDKYIRAGTWLKRGPTPQFSGDRPAVWGDGVVCLHRKGKKRWNGGGKPLVLDYTTVGRNNYAGGGAGTRLHETEKPVAMMMELVHKFTDPGELIWDPYCGSGTTGVACLRLGRRFVGHEMQPHYAETAAERLQAEQRGLTLQSARAGQRSIFDVIE
jgi:site-specific DNA-methyltransferase (adenine-specific)